MELKIVKHINLFLELTVISALSGFMYELLGEQHVTLAGIVVGGFFGIGYWIIDLTILPRFQNKVLQHTILYSIIVKSIIYVVIITIISAVISLIFGYFEGKTLDEFYKSMYDKEQLIFVLYVFGMYVFLSFYIQLKHFFGQNTLFKFLLGKYRKPVKEHRIFMFLDLKSSTTIAEKLGLERYYQFLNDFFHDISNPVYASQAEIYQYVGDEVVFTWETHKGLKNHNCINLFYYIKEKIKCREGYYLREYGEVPKFKSGLHLGFVLCAQIGEVKRELVFNGDVLNTAARIQEQCNVHREEMLLSGQLLEALSYSDNYLFKEIECNKLRGKEKSVVLFSTRQNFSKKFEPTECQLTRKYQFKSFITN